MEVLLPSDYISSTAERISLYTELDHIKTEERLQAFGKNLTDRFGPMPKPVLDLLNTLRLRWVAKDLGFEKIILRDNLMIAHFVSNQESVYYDTQTYQKVMQYILNHPKRCTVKEAHGKLILTIKEVATVSQALHLVGEMQ